MKPMSDFPLPPKTATLPTTPIPASMPSIGNRLETREERDDRLSKDHVSLIFRQCLTYRHASDPNVMRFLASYLLCRDNKQACKEANIPTLLGKQLLRKPDIAEAIREVTEAAVLKHGYDAAEVVERVKEIIQYDPIDMQKPDGTFVESLHDIPPEARRAIKSFKVKNEYGEDPNGMRIVTGKIISVEYWDKMRAAELLGREKDVFKETKVTKHEIGENMSNILLESRKRAEERAVGLAKETTPSLTGGVATDILEASYTTEEGT